MQPNTVSERSGTARQARREEILQVATRVFAERGYRNTDVQEIADIVGVGKATVYRICGTKEELFFAAVDHGMQRLNQLVASDIDDGQPAGSAARMQECLFRFFSFFAENEDLIELLMQERSEFRDRDSHSYTRNWLVNSPRWARRIQLGIEQGILRAVSIEGMMNVFSSLCYGAIFTHYFAKRDMDLKSTAQMMTDVVLNGILSETERQKRNAPNV